MLLYMLGVIALKEAENSKKRRKMNYTLMIFADSKDGRIRQMGIGPAFIESLVVIIVAVIIILSVICYRNQESIALLETENANQRAEIEKLTAENADLVSLREELSDKVTILSDTINQKVEEEEAMEEAQAQAHMPVGFPMSSSASLEEVEAENPMVKLNGSEGSSIIASADGTVVSITTDSGYLHCIKIDHGNGYQSIYRNDGEAMIKEGDEVVRGAILYVIGEDNTALGYQIMYDEKYIDPMDLINIDG